MVTPICLIDALATYIKRLLQKIVIEVDLDQLYTRHFLKNHEESSFDSSFDRHCLHYN